MKKIALLTIAFMCVFGSYTRAEAATEDDQYVGSPFGKNWNVSLGVGAEFHPHRKLIDNRALDVPTGFQFDVAASKWLNPYVGLRLKYAYTSFDITSTPVMNAFIPAGESTADACASALHGDVLLDLTSVIWGYNEDRFYSLKPYVGVGFTSVSASDANTKEYTPTVGLLNEFKLSKPLSLHVDVSMIAPNAGVYGECVGNPRFFTTSATVGLTYFFGKEKARTFTTAAGTAGFLSLLKKNASLTDDVTKLKSANTSLSRDVDALEEELAALRAQKSKVVVENKIKVSPVATFFNINESTVSKRDIARLRYVAEIIKEQPDAKFVIEGHADSATGSKSFNQKLSEKRAEAVCNVLVEKYGVDASQLEPVGKGGTGDLFDDVTLNRAVITRSK